MNHVHASDSSCDQTAYFCGVRTTVETVRIGVGRQFPELTPTCVVRNIDVCPEPVCSGCRHESRFRDGLEATKTSGFNDDSYLILSCPFSLTGKQAVIRAVGGPSQPFMGAAGHVRHTFPVVLMADGIAQ